MRLGLDLLLCGNYPKIAKKAFPKGYALGVLWLVDGIKPAKAAVKAILSSGKCPVVRFHCQWRDDHNFQYSDIAIAVKRTKAIVKFMEQFPDVRYLISPWLEHRANSELFSECVKQVKKVLPKGIKIVSSGDTDIKRVLIERHHSTVPADIFSYDGATPNPASERKFKQAQANCKFYFGWHYEFNCRKSLFDKTPRAQRTLKPTVARIKEIARLIR
jgi:hypothetical protein